MTAWSCAAAASTSMRTRGAERGGAMENRIYLDHAATTPVDPRVLQKMLPYFTEKFGNPNSQHAFGRETVTAVDDARDTVASLIGAKP